MEGEKEVLIRCVVKCEVLGLTTYEDEGMEDTMDVSFYKKYDNGLPWKSRLKDIWKIICGKRILTEDMSVSKSEFLNKVKDL